MCCSVPENLIYVMIIANHFFNKVTLAAGLLNKLS